jgi:hypothetical protein
MSVGIKEKLKCLIKHKWVGPILIIDGLYHYQCHRCFKLKTRKKSWLIRSGFILEPRKIKRQAL